MSTKSHKSAKPKASVCSKDAMLRMLDRCKDSLCSKAVPFDNSQIESAYRNLCAEARKRYGHIAEVVRKLGGKLSDRAFRAKAEAVASAFESSEMPPLVPERFQPHYRGQWCCYEGKGKKKRCHDYLLTIEPKRMLLFDHGFLKANGLFVENGEANTAYSDDFEDWLSQVDEDSCASKAGKELVGSEPVRLAAISISCFPKVTHAYRVIKTLRDIEREAQGAYHVYACVPDALTYETVVDQGYPCIEWPSGRFMFRQFSELVVDEAIWSRGSAQILPWFYGPDWLVSRFERDMRRMQSSQGETRRI